MAAEIQDVLNIMGTACEKAVKESGSNVPEDISIICHIDSETIISGGEKKLIFERELEVRGSTSKGRYS